MRADQLAGRLRAALEPQYRVERELGGGGMSRVFMAVERAFERRVVIKLLEGAHAISAERFAREIRMAASLQQANIVPLLSAGDVEGMPYYVMPFVDGQSLRLHMESHALTIGEVVSILRDMARALAFAHRHGVVHRDVKPENVLLSSGTAVMTDFGIARAIDEARDHFADDARTLTGAGASMGTPAYMAPEQCAGDRVDQRADVYAWGIVALELLAGRHPFAHCTSVRELLTAHMMQPPSYEGVRPETPAALVALVRRCLAKDPVERPASAESLVQELESVVLGASGPQWGDVELHAADTPSVAVMPFSNVSGHPEDDFFADGISEEIMSALARVRGLRVAARTSCFALKGQHADVRTMAERLGVGAILEGSVRRVGTRVRVLTSLVSAEDGLNLWTQRFDRELADIFAVQDEIAQAIAETLGTTLRDTMRRSAARAAVGMQTPGPAGARLRPAGPANVEAYESYLRGRLYLDQRSTDIGAAVACFEDAAAKDPTLSVAHSGLAHVYTWLGLWYIAPAAYAFDKVKQAAERALTLDPNDAVAYAALAIRTLWFEWNTNEALWKAQRAIDLAPGLPLGYSVMTYVRNARAENAESIAAAESALSIDPLSNAARCDLSDALRFAGQYDDALRVLEPVVQRDPGHILGLLWMAYLLDAMGNVSRALEFAERAVNASQRSPAPMAVYTRLLASNGRLAEARAAQRELDPAAQSGYVAPYLRAVASVGIDDPDVTFALLEQSLASRDCHLSLMHRDYFWQPFAADPRYESIITRIGIRPA